MRPPVVGICLAALAAGIWVGYRTVSARLQDGGASKLPIHQYPIAADPGQDLKPLCDKAGIKWPPARMRLLALKRERIVELWAAGKTGEFKRLTTYAITAASGRLGPKRQEGDLQVPEGFYRLTELNPQSKFHLSIKLDYPNETDIAHSKVPRDQIGSDIYFHGKAVSIGCIAVGDLAIERIFDLASRVPVGRRDILVCPVDFRLSPGFRVPGEEEWVGEMYGDLEKALRQLPLDGRSGTSTP